MELAEVNSSRWENDFIKENNKNKLVLSYAKLKSNLGSKAGLRISAIYSDKESLNHIFFYLKNYFFGQVPLFFMILSHVAPKLKISLSKFIVH